MSNTRTAAKILQSNIDASKLEIEKLIIEQCNNMYYYNKDKHKRDFRRDGKWTSDQVYEMFKDDPLWHVKLDKEYESVTFRERNEKITNKKNRNFSMMLFAHYIVKHRWLLSNNATIVIYGGFARSAMIAWNACKTSIYETILCCKRIGIPRDVARIITRVVLDTWCDDFSWFRDKVRDIDMLVSYHNKYKPNEYMFENDVTRIRNILDELCTRTKECVHYYTDDLDRCMTVDKAFDRNCHRRGETSHRDGDYFNYLVTFGAPRYVGEKVTRWAPSINLDITTLIDNDQSDCDVNNLVFYFDFKLQRFRFGLRKQLEYPEGLLTLKIIENQVVKRQFRHVPLDYKKFSSYNKFYQSYRRHVLRADNLEYNGWKQDPRYKKINTSYGEDPYLKTAQNHFKVDYRGYKL